MNETENKTQKKEQTKGVKVIKVVLNTIINILIVLVLITSLLIAVMALTSKASGISNFFGTTVQPIQSNSMKGGSPDGYGGKDFEEGDLVLAKATNYDPDAVYELGDIITFQTQDAEGNDMLLCHRIVDVVKDQNGVTRYQTWGDNRAMSQAPDQREADHYLTASDIASLYYSKDYQGTVIKGLGKPIDFLKTQTGFFFVVLLPMIIFFMYELVRVVLNASNYKKTKAQEEKDEAVKAAVAEALAEKGSQASAASSVSDTSATEAPAGMTAEQMEQFKQFMEFQKMQKAQQESSNTDNKPEE